ncbi:Uncharacterized protein PECH_002428 [Penicillium ucsense]|uniref:Monopolin complex subunit Csm1/Pcs1 C-terminal domain-containing protein n=1 Tax=Penicillium ucsense TaxID=2839758 RepID=A0A8J8W7C3_9EURO|nr:Uncharacterized protein PECM_003057 [Penicillium ucsense]KAF7737963.1 Uncharacterized protein PECH_002428 [Penicillium ucsense]
MPKRKAVSKLSGLVGSDDEDPMLLPDRENVPQPATQDEPPAKRRRGRPRTSSDDNVQVKGPSAPAKRQIVSAVTTEDQGDDPSVSQKTAGRRGRPRAASRDPEMVASQKRAAMKPIVTEVAYEGEKVNESRLSEEEQVAKTTRASTAATRGRGRGRSASVAKPLQMDGEFEYTPTRAPAHNGRTLVSDGARQTDGPADGSIEESVLESDQQSNTHMPSSVVKNARTRLNSLKNRDTSPSKLKSGTFSEHSGDPELRRKIGEITKKHDALETRYRNLREIGLVEANSNMEKLRKQCESVTAASNDLVASLKAELEAQRALGLRSRNLQQQLKDRDAEMAELQSQADEARSQLASSQSEIKALQTKLAAARNTAASLEASKVPGSAIKGGIANRATAAATAEAAQVAQLAQLKEDLYTDFTGLIIRDVKNREADHLYDCIQTGVNGTLHFKLAIPKVASSEYEQAEFQYLPLLDPSRDRELINILPDFLTVDITFKREQASKFYTRVIDALTKRRISTS